VVTGGVDAVLLGTGGGDDGAQRRTADSMVAVASTNWPRVLAERRLECAASAEIDLRFRWPGGVRVCVIAGEKRGSRGYLWGG
jgi:hypothetical protein